MKKGYIEHPSFNKLFSKIERLDDRSVALNLLAFQVVEQLTSLTNPFQLRNVEWRNLFYSPLGDRLGA